MDWQLSTLGRSRVSIVFQNLIRRPAAERDADGDRRATLREANRAMALLDEHLREPPYVAGDSFHDGRHPRRRDGAPLARDSGHRTATAPRRFARGARASPAAPGSAPMCSYL